MPLYHANTQLEEWNIGGIAQDKVYHGSTLIFDFTDTGEEFGYISSNINFIPVQADAAVTVFSDIAVPANAVFALVFTQSAGGVNNTQNSVPQVTFDGGAAAGVQNVGFGNLSSSANRVRMDVWFCPVVGGSSSTFTYTQINGDDSVIVGADIYYFSVAHAQGNFEINVSRKVEVAASPALGEEIGPNIAVITEGSFGQALITRQQDISNTSINATNWVDDGEDRGTGSSNPNNYVVQRFSTEDIAADLTPRYVFDRASSSGDAFSSFIFHTFTALSVPPTPPGFLGSDQQLQSSPVSGVGTFVISPPAGTQTILIFSGGVGSNNGSMVNPSTARIGTDPFTSPEASIANMSVQDNRCRVDGWVLPCTDADTNFEVSNDSNAIDFWMDVYYFDQALAASTFQFDTKLTPTANINGDGEFTFALPASFFGLSVFGSLGMSRGSVITSQALVGIGWTDLGSLTTSGSTASTMIINGGFSGVVNEDITPKDVYITTSTSTFRFHMISAAFIG